MPIELVFSNGATVKVIADLQDVADALESGRTLLDSKRFAGFRGDEVGDFGLAVLVETIQAS